MPTTSFACSVAPFIPPSYGANISAMPTTSFAGHSIMLASPLKESYHTVWFEYHEELISLTGRSRAQEALA
jgi:pyruvate,orthophosphate dikinase